MRQLLWPLPSAEIRQLLCCVRIVVVGYCLALQKKVGKWSVSSVCQLEAWIGKDFRGAALYCWIRGGTGLFLIKPLSGSFGLPWLRCMTCKIWLIFILIGDAYKGECDISLACFCFVQLWDSWLKWLIEITNSLFLRWRKISEECSLCNSIKSWNRILVLKLCLYHSSMVGIWMQHKIIRILWCPQTSTSAGSWCLGGWMSFVSMFSKLQCCWKTLLKWVGCWLVLLLSPEQVTPPPHHTPRSLELKLQVAIVLDCCKLRYVLWDYGGSKW